MAKNLVNSNNIEVVTSDDDLSLDFSKTVKQEIKQIEINKNNIANLKGKVLWTNPSPTSEFSSQTITLNSSDYDLLEIFYYDYAPSSERGCLSARVIKGKNTTLQAMFRESNVEFIGERKINYTSDTQLSVLDNYSIVRANSFNRSVYNDWNVPIYVIGYNTGYLIRRCEK